MQSKELSFPKNKTKLTSDKPTRSVIAKVMYLNENLSNYFENIEDDED